MSNNVHRHLFNIFTHSHQYPHSLHRRSLLRQFRTYSYWYHDISIDSHIFELSKMEQALVVHRNRLVCHVCLRPCSSTLRDANVPTNRTMSYRLCETCYPLRFCSMSSPCGFICHLVNFEVITSVDQYWAMIARTSGSAIP